MAFREPEEQVSTRVHSQQPTQQPTQGDAGNLDAQLSAEELQLLAQKVYALLRRQLRIEGERTG